MAHLVDMHGRPLTFVNAEDKKRAEMELREFLEKNKQLVTDWFKATYFGNRVPVKYDVDNKRWVWVGPR